jgi:hypothetical protein
MYLLRLRALLRTTSCRLHTLSLTQRQFARPEFKLRYQQRAGYAEAAGLSKENIQSRVLEVMKSFEKVDPSKVRISLISLRPAGFTGI